MSKHTCESGDRSSCELCMQFNDDLWDAVNDYAISVGGDPSESIYGNVPRMEAVEAVSKIVDQVLSRQRIDDIVVDDLAKSGNAAAAYACEAGAEAARLRAVLTEVRGFLRGRGVQDLFDYAAVLDRVLDEKKDLR
jgi:hypothetical protein